MSSLICCSVVNALLQQVETGAAGKQQQQQQQQLVSLLLSCLKAISTAAAAAGTGQSWLLNDSYEVLAGPSAVVEASLKLASSDDSSGDGINCMLWLLLLSRSLQVSGALLQAALLATKAAADNSSSSSRQGTSDVADASAAGNQPGEPAAAVPAAQKGMDACMLPLQCKSTLNALLLCIKDAVHWLEQQLPLIALPGKPSMPRGVPGPAGAGQVAAAASVNQHNSTGSRSSSSNTSAAYTELVRQAGQLHESILNYQTAADADSAVLLMSSKGACNSTVEAAATQVVQQQHADAAASADSKLTALEQISQQLLCLSGALAAVLPSKLCCNHSACSSLAKLSEAELVAGKGCRCSG
jgi:hypothetical protein